MPLTLMFAFVLTTDHNTYIENYINRAYWEKSYNILLQKERKIILLFDLNYCLT